MISQHRNWGAAACSRGGTGAAEGWQRAARLPGEDGRNALETKGSGRLNRFPPTEDEKLPPTKPAVLLPLRLPFSHLPVRVME